MLSRSSLETQKLELMSAMSELKLQQAALDRENLELRASNLNNNSITPRRPPVPGRSITSGTTSLNSTPLHGSHNSLQNSTPISMTPKVCVPKCIQTLTLKFTEFLSTDTTSIISPASRLTLQQLTASGISKLCNCANKFNNRFESGSLWQSSGGQQCKPKTTKRSIR